MSIKHFKILIIIFFLFFAVKINFALADSCEELSPVLEKYYQAGQEENFDKYSSVMDMSYVRENLLDNYEDYVKSAWEVYDTKSYEIKKYNCRLDGDNALMYFNLKAKLFADNKDIDTQRNYIALFHKIDNDWKIRYVMDEDVFSQFQNSLYAQLFLDATKDEIHKSVDQADDVIQYNKIVEDLLQKNLPNTVEKGVERKAPTNQNKTAGTKKSVYVFVVIAVVIIAFGIKKVLVNKNN